MIDDPKPIHLTVDEARALYKEVEHRLMHSGALGGGVSSIRRQLDALEPKRIEHTPGPWDVVHGVDYGEIGIRADGIMLITVHGGVDDSIHKNCKPSEESKANAHLIAAAPDLLEWAEETLERYGPLPEPSRNTKRLIATVAKARGNTNDK